MIKDDTGKKQIVLQCPTKLLEQVKGSKKITITFPFQGIEGIIKCINPQGKKDEEKTIRVAPIAEENRDMLVKKKDKHLKELKVKLEPKHGEKEENIVLLVDEVLFKKN